MEVKKGFSIIKIVTFEHETLILTKSIDTKHVPDYQECFFGLAVGNLV